MSGLPTAPEQGRPEPSAPQPHTGFVLGLDVGSSVIRCHVYDRAGRVRGSSAQKVVSLCPQIGWVEIDPDVLWLQFVAVIKESVKAAGIEMNQIVGLGISTQRATFITWNKKTGNHFHNFISWQDLRAIELVKSWNSSLIMKLIHSSCRMLHFFTRSKRFLAASLFTFTTQHVSLRLAWILQNLVEVADQQAAMFGECCFQMGDVKLTMGTGTFLDINTGSNPQQNVGGFYPLIGWKIGQEVVCIAEGNAGDTGTAIKWAQQLEIYSLTGLEARSQISRYLFTDAAETEKMARSLEDSEGVYFVPCFSGLQAPLNDPCACASFMGLKPSTSKYHLVRAILESIAFRNKQLYEVMQKEIRIPVTKIRADGGVCKNSFVMQMTSDLINEKIDRPVHLDMSYLGAASLAGLAVGFWTDKEELKKLRQSEMVFKPQKKWQEYEMSMENWVKAVKRSMNWYNKT
ncbi:putative glycerol kinase 5 isoform X8 [Myotis daubentonii]|uniref:putative glycerol kinase 5 isoform X8 n=1 Tax=Myotis daubentonii TaxID=98922 RepID=UPI002872DE2D|nr:putative glycerol kinase 5 isoform X8 [Myotis daubentonii]